MFTRILVPLDGSVLAASALNAAQTVARHFDCEVQLLRTVEEKMLVPTSPVGTLHPWPDRPVGSLLAEADRYLKTVVYQLEEADIAVTAHSAIGDPAETILATAERENCDLIIMSTHGVTGLGRWLIGSVTEKVVPNAPCPVLAVRSAELPSHMLVALDGSKFAEHIIEPTLALASALSANVTLLRVENRDLRSMAALADDVVKLDPELAERYRLDVLNESHNYLEAIADRYARDDVSIDFHVANGRAARGILAAAEQYDCDLIAMSTHGRSGLARWRYGSVTPRVLRHTSSSMLISRPTNLRDA